MALRIFFTREFARCLRDEVSLDGCFRFIRYPGYQSESFGGTKARIKDSAPRFRLVSALACKLSVTVS
jgi:hypothetical protein